jgi:hypothetical protein
MAAGLQLDLKFTVADESQNQGHGINRQPVQIAADKPTYQYRIT